MKATRLHPIAHGSVGCGGFLHGRDVGGWRIDDPAHAEKAWRAMIDVCPAKNISAILLTPTIDLTAELDDPDDPLNLHAAQIRRLAAEHLVGLADSLERFKQSIRDGVRPTS